MILSVDDEAIIVARSSRADCLHALLRPLCPAYDNPVLVPSPLPCFLRHHCNARQDRTTSPTPSQRQASSGNLPSAVLFMLMLCHYQQFRQDHN